MGVVGLGARRSTVGMISRIVGSNSDVEGPDRCVLDALSLTTLGGRRGLDLGVDALRSAGLGDKLELDAGFTTIGLVGLGGTIGEYDALAATEFVWLTEELEVDATFVRELVEPERKRGSGVACIGTWFEGAGVRIGSGLACGAMGLGTGKLAPGPANGVVGFVGPAGGRGSGVTFAGIWFAGLGVGLGAGLASGVIG
jgi:hypothetical protein